MNNLTMTKEKETKMSEIEDLSLATIKDALDGTLAADDDTVKIAVKMMGVVAKNRQTLTNRSAIEFHMATSIASGGQLRKYIATTNPQIQKALGQKSIGITT